jgi:hypothetical protein
MSQDLYFYQQQIIPEKICRNFTHEEINSAVKSLLKNSNLEENENLRNEIFKELEPNLINISAYDKSIEKLIQKPTKFVTPKSRFLMVDSKILAAIESIVMSEEKSNRSEDMTIQISKDLSILKDLFDKKLLFINLQ